MPITAAGIAVAAVAGPSAASAPAGTTAVGVSQREFRISLYRREVAPGTVRFNVTNFGEDVHDLAVLAPGGPPIAVSPEIKAGRRATLTVRLRRPGTYRVLCTVADHAARGMSTRLRVRRPVRRRP